MRIWFVFSVACSTIKLSCCYVFCKSLLSRMHIHPQKRRYFVSPNVHVRLLSICFYHPDRFLRTSYTNKENNDMSRLLKVKNIVLHHMNSINDLVLHNFLILHVFDVSFQTPPSPLTIWAPAPAETKDLFQSFTNAWTLVPCWLSEGLSFAFLPGSIVEFGTEILFEVELFTFCNASWSLFFSKTISVILSVTGHTCETVIL